MRTLLYITLFLIAGGAYAENWQFTRTLQMGARGPEVFALQKILNADSQTRVANSGPGSPGNETSYFGRATERAVIAFQKLNTILGETGRVGEKTREALNKKLVRAMINPPPTPSFTKEGGAGGGFSPSILSPNPNSRNLPAFLDTVKKVGAEQGYAADTLEALTNDMRSYALSTTTNFFAQFVAENRKEVKKVSAASPLRERIARVLRTIVPRANAQIPSFGGMVLYVFPCTCSGNWLVGMAPLSVPPIALITHYSGTQTYLNFNAPFTLFMLGTYIPQGAPCLFYAALACVPLPSQAQTMPMLGTS